MEVDRLPSLESSLATAPTDGVGSPDVKAATASHRICEGRDALRNCLSESAQTSSNSDDSMTNTQRDLGPLLA
jgi:hypothetical protein